MPPGTLSNTITVLHWRRPLYPSGSARETESVGYVYIKRFIVSSWLMQLWMLARQVQDPQGRLSESGGWNAQAELTLLAVHRQNFLFLRKAWVLFLKPLNWVDESIQIMEDNFLYMKWTDCTFLSYLPRLAFAWITGKQSPVKMAHKTDHHNGKSKSYPEYAAKMWIIFWPC